MSEGLSEPAVDFIVDAIIAGNVSEQESERLLVEAGMTKDRARYIIASLATVDVMPSALQSEEEMDRKNRQEYAESLKHSQSFRHTPEGPVPIPPPTYEQHCSMEEQRKRMFTPEGELRMVVKIREACAKGLFKPGVGFVEKDSS